MRGDLVNAGQFSDFHGSGANTLFIPVSAETKILKKTELDTPLLPDVMDAAPPPAERYRGGSVCSEQGAIQPIRRFHLNHP